MGTTKDDTTPPPLSDYFRQIHERALRHSLWVALVHARCLGDHELQGMLTTMVVAVKEKHGVPDQPA